MTAPDRLLDYAAISERSGIARATLRAYHSRGLLPEPDVMLAHLPRWRTSTIEAWLATRPGKPGRPVGLA